MAEGLDVGDGKEPVPMWLCSTCGHRLAEKWVVEDNNQPRPICLPCLEVLEQSMADARFRAQANQQAMIARSHRRKERKQTKNAKRRNRK